MLLVCTGCNFSEGDENGAARILREPPFKTFTDSIKDYPDNPDLYLKRAQLLIQKKYTALAVNDYRKAWELRP